MERRPHLVSCDIVTGPRALGGLGLRDMSQLNSASTVKLEWSILIKPESSCTRVLCHKHCKDTCDINMFNAKSDASNMWKGIFENAHIIREGARESIGEGEGRGTMFWTYMHGLHQNHSPS